MDFWNMLQINGYIICSDDYLLHADDSTIMPLKSLQYGKKVLIVWFYNVPWGAWGTNINAVLKIGSPRIFLFIK